jgi:hypothetical protein
LIIKIINAFMYLFYPRYLYDDRFINSSQILSENRENCWEYKVFFSTMVIFS